MSVSNLNVLIIIAPPKDVFQPQLPHKTASKLKENSLSSDKEGDSGIYNPSSCFGGAAIIQYAMLSEILYLPFDCRLRYFQLFGHLCPRNLSIHHY